MILNDGQRSAVDARISASTNVVAGAGTGKTRVLVERYLRFVREGTPPSRLLALTFTLKAAEEMRSRIFESIDAGRPELLRELYSAWILNFHSFGYRVMREHAPAFGVDPGVDVATAAEIRQVERIVERRFMDGRIDGVEADFGGLMPPPARLRSLVDMYLGVVNRCRSDMIPVADLVGAIRPDDAEPYAAAVRSIEAVSRALAEEMRRRNLIDFSDMISLTTRGLLDNPPLARLYREKFDHILVDEFQDTSTAQFELLRVLSGGDFSRVTVVGDEKQSIYRWRDARVENIREFPGSPLGLEENYRSRQNILDLAHTFVCRDGELAKRARRLVAVRGEAPRPVVLFHPGDDKDGPGRYDAEARALAAWVSHLTGGEPVPGAPELVGGATGEDPLGYGDIAVLLRAVREHKVLPAIERVFRDARIPYVVLGGADATGTLALELLYSYLSLLRPGDRRLDLLHVLESRPFDIGQASLMPLFEDSGEGPFDAFSLLSDDRVGKVGDPDARARLVELRALLDRLDRAHASAAFREFLMMVLEETPFFLKMFDGGAATGAVDSLVNELMDICDTLERKGDLGLWVFLDYLRAALGERSFHKDEAVFTPENHVRIMTIHQAKGLEFPAVAVAGIRSSRPDSSGFFVSRETGVYSGRWEEWGRGYKDLEEREAEKRMRKQEERCLLYVAMTRARDFLFASSPVPGGKKTLFEDVLGCVEESRTPYAIIRDIPSDVRARTVGESAAADIDLAAIVADWRAVTERRRTHRATAAASALRLSFVNWTALERYARCPLQYRYRAGLDLPDVEGNGGESPRMPGAGDGEGLDGVAIPPGVSPAGYGVFVHRLLREAMEFRARGSELPDDWIRAAAALSGIPQKYTDELARAAGRIVAPFLDGEISRPGREMRLEEPFQVRLDGLVLHGVFDRVERPEGGWCVIDYKIGRERESYAFQVSFYAWALGRITGEAGIGGQVCYLRESGVTVTEVDPATAGIEAVVHGLEGALETGKFDANPGPRCHNCPCSRSCAYATS